MDVNSCIFFQHHCQGNLIMGLTQLINVKFDINEIPWQFLTITGLIALMKLSEQPIYMNSRNDLYLTTEFIGDALREEIFWKGLRPDAAAASDIPNYIDLILKVADHGISNEKFLDAVL